MEANMLKMEISARPENVSFARAAVAAFASQLDWNLNDLDEIKVAVSEAVSNCIIHGYQNKGIGNILIYVNMFKDGLEIIIEDNGIGIDDIEEAMEPAYSTDPERMGMGFTFMKSFMDKFSVDSIPKGGTKIIMRKMLNDIIQKRAAQ